MKDTLKILLLEDNQTDAKLVDSELKKANLNYSLRNADNEDDFIAELKNFKPDIILSDFNLPQFSGLEALEITKNICIETPFLLVTGNLDEETAVSCIKLGAWDYILKDRLVRLVPAINSALKLKEEINAKNKAIEGLKKSEAKYLDLYDNAPDMFLSIDPKTGIIINCNKTLLKNLGYKWEEFVGKEIYDFYTEENRLYAKEVLFPLFTKTGRLKGSELQVLKKDGSIIDVSLTNSAVYNEEGQITHSRSIWRNITEKKKTQETIRKSEEKYRAMLDANQDIVIIKSPNNSISYMNPAARLKIGDRKSFSKCHKVLFDSDTPCKDCQTAKSAQIKTHHREITDPNDNTVYLASYFPIKNIDGSDSIMCIYKDITSLRNIENERLGLLNILEATQNEIYIIDQVKNKFTYVNESAVQNTGYSKEELLKISPFDLLINFNKENLSEIIRAVDKNDNKKTVFEAKIKRLDDSIYPVEMHIQLVKQQEINLILVIIIDITERQKKDELILKLSKGIEQSPTAVVITDLNGNIEFINPKFTETSGYLFDEVKGKNSRILKSGFTKDDEYVLLWKTITDGEIWHGEFLNKKKNGDLYWEEAVIGPIKDKNDNITHFIGLKQDISTRKMMEEELRLDRISLSKRVDERTAELSILNAELAKALRMKDEFLANMSHELRTPLNAILALSEVMQEEVYGPMNQNQIKSLRTIEDSGRHLLNLINDILDVAKVGAGKVELEIFEVSIFSVCQACLSFIKQPSLKKNITYSLKIETKSETIFADERRLKQILINLLSNAVKFTPSDGSIGLSVKEDESDGIMNFTIWDTGIGISLESLSKLFKPFTQIDSSLSREYNGTGLGLTLVKSLTELHGGCVTVESTPGKGSSFTISIPFKTVNIIDKNTKEGDFQLFAQSKNLHSIKKIFVIEESYSDLGEFPLFIDELSLEYFLKQDNVDLIGNITNFKPDIIVLKLEFANNSSWNKFEQIKANESTANIPLIVISDAENLKDIKKREIDNYIIKPITKEKLEGSIRKYIKSTNDHNSVNNTKEKALVLIAEDNENNIEMLIDYLQDLNYKLLIARNGKEAVRLVEEKYPDIILMDIQMPELDGIDATRMIRKNGNKKIAKTPIIAVTALVMPGDKQRCFDAGVNGYLKKPLSLKKLVLEIENLLSLNSNK